MINPKNKTIEDKHRESITLTQVFIFLGFLLVILISFVFYLKYSSFSPLNLNKIKVDGNIDLGSKYLEEIKKPSVVLEMTISEAELGQIIKVNDPSFPLKKAELKIKPEGIIINGKTSNMPWGMKVDALVIPIVQDGKLNFEIKEIKTLGVIAPPKISDALNPKFSTLFENIIPQSNQVEITDVKTLLGKLFIEGKKK